MRIGIVGAGLTGLTAAWALCRAGHTVTVCEQAPEAGGLAATFPLAGTQLEKFYHHIFTTDLESIRLIRALGLEKDLIWKATPMGMYQSGRLLEFATPWDLLNFTPLTFSNRIRFGLIILYLAHVQQWQKYEHRRAETWIKHAFGSQAWDVIWGPLLHGKFGDYASDIGMPWFYSRVHTRAGSREKGMTKESLGYLKGSFQVLHNALVQAIQAYGGTIHYQTAVQSFTFSAGRVAGWRTAQGEEDLDAILATLAPPALLLLLPDGLMGAYWEKLKQIQYLGNVCAVLTLKRSLSPIYWMNIPDLQSPFIAVIEHTNFIPPETYGGQHVVYLSSYLATNHPRYQADQATLLSEFYAYLKKIIPSFSEDDIQQVFVFHAPYAQPVIRVGYAANLVDMVSPLRGLYVANMAQIYPEDRGMSYSIRLGQRAAEQIIKILAAA